jgi:hypothetical protein
MVLVCITLSFDAIAHTKTELNELAIQFIEAKNARQQPNSDEKNVDHYLSLIADDFIDEHVKHNFIYSDKSKLRSDMINKLKDKIVFSNIEINDMLIGKNVVFMKVTETGKIKPAHLDKIITYESTNLLSLEFNTDGLIKHIRRHNG